MRPFTVVALGFLVSATARGEVIAHGGVDLGVGYTPSAPVELPLSLFGGATIPLGETLGLEVLAVGTFSGRRAISLEPLVSGSLRFGGCCTVATLGAGASFGTEHLLTVAPWFSATIGWFPARLVASVRLLDAKPLLAISVRLDLVSGWLLLRQLVYR